MKSKELTNVDRLNLISDMINQSKKNLAKGSSFYFIFWGWVILVANLTHFIIQEFELYHAPYVIWNITIPATIITWVYSFRKQKYAQVQSHIDKIIGVLWVTLTISTVSLLFFVGNVKTNINAIIMGSSAIGTFITGFILRFNPLKWGGVALWICSILAFSIDPSYQHLISALGVLLGYLIPGYLLKRAESE